MPIDIHIASPTTLSLTQETKNEKLFMNFRYLHLISTDLSPLPQRIYMDSTMTLETSALFTRKSSSLPNDNNS